MRKFFLLYGAFLTFIAIICMDITCSPKPPMMHGDRATKGWSRSAFLLRERREQNAKVITRPFREQKKISEMSEGFAEDEEAQESYTMEEEECSLS